MSSENSKSLLRAEHISKTYGEKKVLEDISIHLEQGELVSLLGVSGSGKTTLFHILSGLVTPDEGKVYLRDQDVTSTPGSISYMLQKDLLLPWRSIQDNIILGATLQRIRRAFGAEIAEQAVLPIHDMGACAAGSGRNRRSAQHHGLRHRLRP